MNAAFAAIAGVTAILSWMFIGGKTATVKWVAKKHNLNPN